jgi:hypothetical protein
MWLPRYSRGMGLRESVSASVSQGCDIRDQAAVDLALKYAEEIDEGMDLGKLGPLLLAALDALLLSPKARAAAKKAVTDDKPAANALDQLAGRRARRGRAEDLDATAT